MRLITMKRISGLLWVVGVLGMITGGTMAETAVPTPAVIATPTIDRLAAPPTVQNPTQADEGAQLYWLNCQPCHGDRGQGLTDEWRAQYPLEDQNCWARGCHGERPYEDGFTVPTVVPAVIGEGSLSKFDTAGKLYDFMRVSMPFNAPNSLTTEEYLAITAFLVRAQGKWNGIPLDEKNVAEMRLLPAPTATPQLTITPTAVFTPIAAPTAPSVANVTAWPFLVGGILFLAAGGVWIWNRRKQ